MMSDVEIDRFELICAVVDCGLGSKIIQKAKEHGVMGGTVFLGKVVTGDHILKFLPMAYTRKEIVWMVCSGETAVNALDVLEKTFCFETSGTGLAFTTSVSAIFGSSGQNCEQMIEEKDVNQIMYAAITVIVDKGKAEQVVDAAIAAGSNGGTIINARGSGVHETSKLFSMDIEPEKEIVLIISQATKVNGIVASIREQLKMDDPGNGLIFTQNVKEAYGAQ